VIVYKERARRLSRNLAKSTTYDWKLSSQESRGALIMTGFIHM
jgi:hypothetical protein